MAEYVIISGPQVRWNIEIEASDQLQLKSIQGYSFLNPYKYGVAYQEHDFLSKNEAILINDKIQMVTTGLILQRFDNSLNPEPQHLFGDINTLLKYFRYTSNQFDMKYNSSVSVISEREAIRLGIHPNIIKTNSMFIRGDYFNSMASWRDLEIADKLSSEGFNIPIYEEILMDAIDGRYNHEYRKTILYSAIAVESMLANKYDEEYGRLMSENSPRLTLIQDQGGVKDPIFKALTNGSDFKKLLHEIPLYLYGKSLLMENEMLYNFMLKLYTTRNKIVHWGTPINPNYDQVLEINSIGSSQAIQIALNLFLWMGIEKYREISKNDMVGINLNI